VLIFQLDKTYFQPDLTLIITRFSRFAAIIPLVPADLANFAPENALNSILLMMVNKGI